MKQFISKYKHGVVLFYGIIYMLWFTYLERTVTTEFTPVYSRLDDYIPFREIFIIPYTVWFLYIFITIAYFFLTSKTDFFKTCAYLFIGMTICLIIYTVWPNGHYLRVDLDSLGRSNIFIDMLAKIYSVDTATNVFPSIHVYNSIGAMIAIYKSEKLHSKKWLQVFVIVLTVLISLSTVYLKQHSVLDIFGAVALSIIMYVVVYVPDWAKVFRKENPELSKVSQ
ncbi:phosphatase PAP2 family protein [Mobilitalea sibirica]|uniref:Phosphatase PAP2 family protein n=1 Tax=Mobilitalea sibirica TaxID=1462919 RepID=A0A8J7H246_9FIRM|nr:phosphatase PAP2 family protein [Mobilitalea sibirica]